MRTIEVEIAVMKYFGVRRNIIVPNVYWGIRGLNYECDLIRLTKNNYATEIEIKVSKSDLLKDKKKHHGHKSNLFKYLYFAVPEELTVCALLGIPERAGLLAVRKVDVRNREYYEEDYIYEVDEIKKPSINPNCRKWNDSDRLELTRLGAIRILGMKQKIERLEKQLN